MRTRSLLAIGLLGLTWLSGAGMLGGCNMFEPAVAEPPQSAASVREDFSEPESTLATMSRAFNAQQGGADAYTNAFATPSRDGLSYTTVFDPAVVIARNYTGSLDWDASMESNFYRTFIDKFIGRDTLGWDRVNDMPDDNIPGSSTWTLNRRYDVINLGSQRDTIATGIATLTFAQVSSRWVIVNWVDKAIYVKPTEGEAYSFSWRRLDTK